MTDISKILCIGNSHTAGFPDYDPMMGGNPESSYQHWLKKGLLQIHPENDFSIMNEGICGDTSRGIVLRLIDALGSMQPGLVILAGGTNDLGMTGESQIAANLEEGCEACRKSKIPLIATSIPPISLYEYVARVKTVNSSIEAYASNHQSVFFADWFDVLKDKQGFLEDRCNSGDGVHLSVEGYKRIGSLLVPIVSKALALKL